MCWAGCTATRDRGVRPPRPSQPIPSDNRPLCPQADDTAPSVSAAQQSGPRSTYCISPHDFGRKHAARCIGHRSALHQPSQRAASANAPHCAPGGNSRKRFSQYPERKRETPRTNCGKMSFRHHKIAMRELQKCLFRVKTVLKTTFFSIFLFICKTSKKQLFVTLGRKMPVWPLMSQGCAEAM